MTNKQFLSALKTLGLGKASQSTAEALGISVRQLQRLCSGESNISEPIAKIITYLKEQKPK